MYLGFFLLLSVFGICVASLFDPPCFTNVFNNTLLQGKCIHRNKCSYSQNFPPKKHLQTCSSSKDIVCCPISIVTRQKEVLNSTKSDEKCREYIDKRLFRTSIIGGSRAKPREFPHIAILGYGDNKSDIKWACGGTLISENFILTAAHCVKNREYGAPTWVRLGDLVLNETSDDAMPQDIEVENFILHDNYTKKYNDIALIKLKSRVAFGLYVRPACINTMDNLSGVQLQAIGWGKTDVFAETISNHLMKVFLNLVQFDKCNEIYSNIPKDLPRGINKETQFCAGDEDKDTCQGDSGGPLHFLKKAETAETVDHFVVAGITSFGKGCGYIGVYTKVSSYRQWIESRVWPE